MVADCSLEGSLYVVCIIQKKKTKTKGGFKTKCKHKYKYYYNKW